MRRPPGPLAVVAGLAAAAAVLAVLLLAGDADAPDDAEAGRALRRLPAAGGRPCGPAWGPAVNIGRLPGARHEVSGFVASPGHPGIAWMVPDSGNPAVLYSFELAVDDPPAGEPPAGTGRIRSRVFPVRGATNGDWEDLASTTGPDGRGRLWILDNIRRRSAPKTFWEVVEPDPDHDTEAVVVGRYQWEYPDVPGGGRDTETAFFLGGTLHVVSKSDPSRVYRFEAPLDPAAVNRPVPVATVPAGVRMVLGSTSADERLLVVSSTRDRTAWVYENRSDPSDVTGFFDQPAVFSLRMSRSQREAGDFFPHAGCDIVLVSESQSVWLLPNQR